MKLCCTKPWSRRCKAQQQGLSDHFEFKFNKCCDRFRKAFLRRVAQSAFRVRAIDMRKGVIYSPELRQSKDSFYRYAIKMVLQHSFGAIKKARLKMDGHEDREFRRELFSYLRKQLRIYCPDFAAFAPSRC